MGYNGGTATVNSADFYGVDTNEVEAYINQIKAIAIDQARDQLDKTDTLFNVLRDGWVGHAEENFEKNFIAAKDSVKNSLQAGYDALVSEINQIGQGWIDQDAGMVQVQEGGK